METKNCTPEVPEVLEVPQFHKGYILQNLPLRVFWIRQIVPLFSINFKFKNGMLYISRVPLDKQAEFERYLQDLQKQYPDMKIIPFSLIMDSHKMNLSQGEN